jgi:hypothetical protein
MGDRNGTTTAPAEAKWDETYERSSICPLPDQFAEWNDPATEPIKVSDTVLKALLMIEKREAAIAEYRSTGRFPVLPEYHMHLALMEIERLKIKPGDRGCGEIPIDENLNPT